MKLSLYQKLALSFASMFFIMASLFVWWSNQVDTITRQQAEQSLHAELAAHLVHENPLLSQGVRDYAGLKDLFRTQMILGPNFEFYYVGPQGEILTYAAEPGKVKRQYVDLAPVTTMIAGNSSFPIYGDDPRNLDKQKIFSAAPVYADDNLQGYLYVIIGGEQYDSVFATIKSSQQLTNTAVAALATVMFLFVVSLGLLRFFTHPLRQLTQDMNRVRQHGFVGEKLSIHRWEASSNSEIQQLGCAFQEMLDHIDAQFQQLQQADTQRRELLADLSHDLRTPLASLQGYIETVALKGDALSHEERQTFIEIALKNANDIKKLIDQIFELAYLEGGQVTLHQEAFPLGDLIYDVMAKFSLKAQKKNITLLVNPDQFDFQVYTDIGKLERVLSNLLENAIRHTPENGEIAIRLAQLNNKLQIAICDTGSGISEKEIAYIFDARYQASNSKGRRDKNVGLGLAITKKLLRLLDSDIQVESELGKGTRFSFQLAMEP